MKTTIILILAACLSLNLANAQNLLLNGDFNSQNNIASTNNGLFYATAPDDWTQWSYGADGWSNRQKDDTTSYSYDGSFYIAVGGGDGASGGGIYQTVSGTAGLTYDLTVESSVQNWWWPQGEMRLFFLDASSATLNEQVLDVTTGITAYDTGLPWASYSVMGTAPVGTTQVKVEFASQSGTGTVFFDNAVLTVVPEPSTWAMLVVGGVALFGCRRTFRRS